MPGLPLLVPCICSIYIYIYNNMQFLGRCQAIVLISSQVSTMAVCLYMWEEVEESELLRQFGDIWYHG